MKKKKKLICWIIILILIIVAVVFVLRDEEKTDNKIVETQIEKAEVSQNTIISTLTAPGEVKSADIEKITFNTNYYFLTLCVEKGDYVKAGENLLEYKNGTYITAPFNCVVTDYNIPTAKEICTSSNYIEVSSVDDLYMDINISEEEIRTINVNQEVEIVANYDESKVYTGIISKINAIGTYSNGRTTFAAITSIKNDGTLKLGMSATCNVTIEKNENVLTVPIAAVEIEDGKRYVNVVDELGNITRKEIETGISDANNVQVVSGLELGENIQYEKETVTIIEDDEEEAENPFSSLFGGMNKKGGRM